MEIKKKVLITGSNGDIGRALCKKFSNSGWVVFGIDKQKQSSISIDLYQQLNFLKINEHNIQRVIRKIAKNFFYDGLNCLINNAALQIKKPFDNLSLTDLNNSYAVNFFAPFFLSQQFIEPLTKKRGNIINISSIHSILTKKEFTAYSTSKCALDGLTRSMVIEYGDKIQINSIRPAAIYTKMLKQGIKSLDKLNNLKKFHPSQSIGDPELISKIAFLLASNDNSFLNGSIIDVSGGISSKLHDPE